MVEFGTLAISIRNASSSRPDWCRPQLGDFLYIIVRLSYHTIAIVYCNDCVLHDAIVVVVTMGEYCKMLQCCICFGLGPGILASPDALDLAFFDQSNDLTFDRSISAPYSIFLL